MNKKEFLELLNWKLKCELEQLEKTKTHINHLKTLIEREMVE